MLTGPQAIEFRTALLISRVREAAGKRPLDIEQLDEDEWVKKYWLASVAGLGDTAASEQLVRVDGEPAGRAKQREADEQAHHSSAAVGAEQTTSG